MGVKTVAGMEMCTMYWLNKFLSCTGISLLRWVSPSPARSASSPTTSCGTLPNRVAFQHLLTSMVTLISTQIQLSSFHGQGGNTQQQQQNPGVPVRRFKVKYGCCRLYRQNSKNAGLKKKCYYHSNKACKTFYSRYVDNRLVVTLGGNCICLHCEMKIMPLINKCDFHLSEDAQKTSKNQCWQD